MKMKKPLLCVLVLVMSVSLIMVFSSGGCRRAEPPVEEVTDEPEEALDESEKEEIVEEATATPVTPLPTTEQRWQECVPVVLPVSDLVFLQRLQCMQHRQKDLQANLMGLCG